MPLAHCERVYRFLEGKNTVLNGLFPKQRPDDLKMAFADGPVLTVTV